MSDASHGSDVHAEHAHEAYEGKPADSIPPDEPHTPGWLPVAGAALLLAGIMAFALSGPGDGEGEPATAATVEAQPEAAPPAADGEPTPDRQPRRAAPAGSLRPRLPGLPSGMRPIRRPPPPRPEPAP